MTKQLLVLTKRCNEGLSLERINGELEGLQKFVGGYIEVVRVTDEIDLICDEEFLFKDYQPNIKVEDGHGWEVVIHGDCFFTKHNDEGDFVNLTTDDVDKLLTEIKILGYTKK